MKKSLPLQPELPPFTVIAPQSQLEGTLRFSGITRLNCSFKGDIYMQENSQLYLEKESQIHANIEAYTVQIRGSFSGKLRAQEKIIICSGAVVKGELESPNLVIEPGAMVNAQGQTT